MKTHLIVGLAAALLALAGITTFVLADGESGSAATATKPVAVSAGSIAAGDAIAKPRRPVLTLVGVEQGNAGGRVTELDVRTLERFPTVGLRVYEPFVKRRVSFRGVRLADLLRITGVPRSSVRIYMRALDDYHVRFTQHELAASGALLATRADGNAIALKAGGPVRVVFPPGTPVAANSDNWIWSVDLIKAGR